MNKLSRFSIIGITVSVLLLIYKPALYSKILAGISLIIFVILFLNPLFRKSK
jgi:hypothetical protein